MSFDRRNFFKTICVAGATLAIGNSFGAGKPDENPIEFQGVLYDSTRCLGCRACERVCAEAHGLPEAKDELKAGVIRNTSESQRSVINNHITSRGEVYVKKQCMHCNEPACAAACLTQAMHKTKEGPVVWRGDKCMGCRYCMISCPFDVPKFEYNSANPKIEKCDMCFDRLKAGKIPACAEACPGDAITFGTRRELIDEARKRIFESPKDYVNQIYGEEVAGGTGWLYLSSAPFNEVGFNPKLQNSSYPELSKGFLYTVPSVFVLLPPLLLGIHEATKNRNHTNEDENE
jgi:Fe-S-cluster-containing dehydrogenase component